MRMAAAAAGHLVGVPDDGNLHSKAALYGDGHLTCKLCAWLRSRFGADCDSVHDSLWQESDSWERAASNEYELWSEQSDRNRDLIEQADAIYASDPDAALRLYLEAAEAGSVWAMELIGWHHHTGTHVTADFGKAQEYYYRATCAGSWMATIKHARLLATHGYPDHCNGILEDGVQAAFIPACFWLAWFRYKQSPTRKTCREVGPLLERAAEMGHPGAGLMLARWMARGRFGLREIPKGFSRLLEIGKRAATEPDARPVDGLRPVTSQS